MTDAHRPGRAPEATDDAVSLERLIDEAGLGVLALDASLTVKRANHSAHVLLERRAGSLVGRSAIEAFLDHRTEALVREASGGTSQVGELAVGKDRVLVVRARPVGAGGATVVLEDVTELRRLQRIRTEFIDNLSHELRTPLSTIRLLTETLSADMDRVEVPAKVRDRVAKIDVETGHLVQMVSELLDLSRIEQAATDIELTDMGVERVVQGAADRLRTFADRQGVTLRVELPRDGELPHIRGDEERLGQLLINLVHNAVKFSAPGTEVVLRAVTDGEHLQLSVTDHGVGIPRADIDRVFERFYKVDKARARGMGGTGLGLAIARHIAESHGGSLSVASREGRGSTFTLFLPVPPQARAVVTEAP